MPSLPRLTWLKAPKPEIRFLDFDEAARLIEGATADPLGHVMIVTGLNTGLRLGEMLALKWNAVDLRAGRLHVREAVARGVVGTPKSGRSREVPLNDTVLAALRAHRHLRGPLVFCREDGSMLTKNEAKAALRRARQKAGIMDCGWHTLRHLRYAHLSPTVTRDAVRTLDEPRQPDGNPRGEIRKRPRRHTYEAVSWWRRRESNPGPEAFAWCVYVRSRQT
jgi:integrase